MDRTEMLVEIILAIGPQLGLCLDSRHANCQFSTYFAQDQSH